MTDEKFDEKEMEKREEKREEKSPEEKSWDEKYRRDPLGSFIWACIIIWAGLVLLADNMNLLNLKQIPGLPAAFQPEPWSVILIGAGVIVLIEVVIRLLVPAYSRPIFGSLIFAMILIGVGLGNLTNWNVAWALILIVIGLSIIFRSFRGKSKSE
jgi:divalent metal cation (Fe/Co/Zn/Cd) transporter